MAFETAVLVEGVAVGELLRLDEALSFWGGFDPVTGRIIDVHHPQLGRSVTGRVLAMPHGRGSSSSSQVVAEALRLGTGPRAVILSSPDPIIMLGAFVAGLLYEAVCPVVVAQESDFDTLRTGTRVTVNRGGSVTVSPT